jgi:serine/threonine protein kinase
MTKSDIYSLGVILLELMVCFTTGMERAMVLSSLKNPAQQESALSSLDPYPVEKSLVERLVSHTPEFRPSAAEILEIVDDHLELLVETKKFSRSRSHSLPMSAFGLAGQLLAAREFLDDDTTSMTEQTSSIASWEGLKRSASVGALRGFQTSDDETITLVNDHESHLTPNDERLNNEDWKSHWNTKPRSASASASVCSSPPLSLTLDYSAVPLSNSPKPVRKVRSNSLLLSSVSSQNTEFSQSEEIDPQERLAMVEADIQRISVYLDLLQKEKTRLEEKIKNTF